MDKLIEKIVRREEERKKLRDTSNFYNCSENKEEFQFFNQFSEDKKYVGPQRACVDFRYLNDKLSQET